MKKRAALALVFVVGALESCRQASPHDLGQTAGRLSPCPSSPNCVSSQAQDAKHRVEPLRFEGAADAARARLKAVIEAMPRARIVAEEGPSLRAEFVSRLFRFVDDVEFLFGDGVIDVRSASRVGYSDLGVNRRRVEQIRKLLAAAR